MKQTRLKPEVQDRIAGAILEIEAAGIELCMRPNAATK